MSFFFLSLCWITIFQAIRQNNEIKTFKVKIIVEQQFDLVQ